MGGLSILFSSFLPNYSTDIVNAAFNDLYNLGLHNTPELGVTMTKHGILQRRITELGNRYLRYITLPEGINN